MNIDHDQHFYSPIKQKPQNKYDELINKAMDNYQRSVQHGLRCYSPNQDNTALDIPNYRSLNDDCIPFSDNLFCSVTQNQCDIGSFIIFERADHSLDVAYGVESQDIAREIQKKYSFYPAASGDPKRKIIGHHKLIDKLNLLPKPEQDRIKNLSNLKQVGDELSQPTKSATFVTDNFAKVLDKVKKILIENLSKFQEFDTEATVRGPLTISDFSHSIILGVGKILFMYSDHQTHPGTMCPKNEQELLKYLKKDIAGFPIYYLFEGHILGINETHITLKSGQKFLIDDYLTDNGENITLDIDKFALDFKQGLGQDSDPVYRSLSFDKVTFGGFS